MKITMKTSPNRNIGRLGNTPALIVCHTTGGSASSAINTCMNPQNSVSYHYVVSGAGEVTQLVDITDTAWANGTTVGGTRCHTQATHPLVRSRSVNANSYTVSIGFGDMTGGVVSDAAIGAGAWLLGHITEVVRDEWDVPIAISRETVVGHHEVTPITRPNCPGPAFDFEKLLSYYREEEEMLGILRLLAGRHGWALCAAKNILQNAARVQSLEQVQQRHPWALRTVTKLIDRGVLLGRNETGDGLNLTKDMLRLLVLNDRAGLYDMQFAFEDFSEVAQDMI